MSAQASASSGVETLIEDIVQVAFSSGVGRRLTGENNASTVTAVIRCFATAVCSARRGRASRASWTRAIQPPHSNSVQIHLTDYLYIKAASS